MTNKEEVERAYEAFLESCEIFNSFVADSIILKKIKDDDNITMMRLESFVVYFRLWFEFYGSKYDDKAALHYWAYANTLYNKREIDKKYQKDLYEQICKLADEYKYENFKNIFGQINYN